MSVDLQDDQDRPVAAARLLRLAEYVLGAEGYDLARTEMGLTLLAPEAMAEMHAGALGREGPTDVLSLPVDDLVPGRAPVHDPDGPPVSAGDVFICPAEVGSRATRLGVGFEEHMALMVVHGVLHLLGYEHADESDADVMEAREQQLLAAFRKAAR